MKAQDILNSIRALVEGRKRAYAEAGRIQPVAIATAIQAIELSLPRNASPADKVYRFVNAHRREIELILPRTKHYRKYRMQLLNLLRYCQEHDLSGEGHTAGPMRSACGRLAVGEER